MQKKVLFLKKKKVIKIFFVANIFLLSFPGKKACLWGDMFIIINKDYILCEKTAMLQKYALFWDDYYYYYVFCGKWQHVILYKNAHLFCIGESKSGCRLPTWISSRKKWESLDGGLRLEFPTEGPEPVLVWVNSTVMRAQIGSDYIVKEESQFMCFKPSLEVTSDIKNSPLQKTRLILYQLSGWWVVLIKNARE